MVMPFGSLALRTKQYGDLTFRVVSLLQPCGSFVKAGWGSPKKDSGIRGGKSKLVMHEHNEARTASCRLIRQRPSSAGEQPRASRLRTKADSGKRQNLGAKCDAEEPPAQETPNTIILILS